MSGKRAAADAAASVPASTGARKRARPAAHTATATDTHTAAEADKPRAAVHSSTSIAAAPAGAASAAASSRPSPPSSSASGPGKVIIVLQQASLEAVKTKKGFELLNCDDHVGLHKRAGRDPARSRPDITHQLLLALLDSPLNKSGRLRVFVETTGGVLIDVSSSTRIPRTFKRFAGLMVQLLYKMRVRAADSSETLLKVIKNPVTAHLPVGAPIVGLEAGAEVVDAFDLPGMIPLGGGDATREGSVVFVVGAMSHGDITGDYIQKTVSLSRYPLSAACAVSKLMNAYEHAWGIL